ncbi:MAG: hypothetical protein A3K10_15080 [Bacteroidetes bacterium RIFCSPLOWO2_12_FULL_31_6]|nr:MAG: hypothetical protein A3K10_15080 [Bacteroidetes bacterium RIFCSPLOWO2_12_FULL_31_6]
MKKLLLIPFLLIVYTAVSQNYKPGKNGGGLYSTGQNVVDKGWFFGLGITYMLPYSPVSEKIETSDSLNQYTTTYFAQHKNTFAKSFTTQFGPSVEIGKFKMNDKKIINYMDYSLSWKWFRGGENYSTTTFVNNNLTSSFETRGTYSDHFISANFNLGYRFDQSEKKFFVNGLGLNLDYALIKGRTGTPPIPNKTYVDGPSSILGEMHYFFGIGFKTSKRLIIMPIIETPILALYPFNHIVSTHPYFNTRARPILIRVRFMFLKKGSKSCPKVYNPMGIDPDKQLE